MNLELFDPATQKIWTQRLRANELCVIGKGIHHKLTEASDSNRLCVITFQGSMRLTSIFRTRYEVIVVTAKIAENAEKSAVITVIPAKAGVQERSLDSGVRRNDVGSAPSAANLLSR